MFIYEIDFSPMFTIDLEILSLLIIIFQCGRPATVGNCKECGAPIGGEGHQALPGNVPDDG